MGNVFYFLARLLNLFPPSAVKNSKLNHKSWISSKSQIINSEIGKYSYLGHNCILLNTRIGNYCSIGSDCFIGGSEHPLSFVSTSPVFYGGYRKSFSIKKYCLGNLKWNSNEKKVVIGNDVWIGNKVILKNGISVADGAVIGAGSVVTKDIGPYEVWAGNPAKFIKKRFEDEIINELLDIQWWDMPDSALKGVSRYMNDPRVFISAIRRDER